MIGRGQRSVGLLGRILAILLLTVVVEFGASTLLYERASQFLVREDEARRLAEHLVISAKLVNERPWTERAAVARELTTDRYDVSWSATLPPPLPPVAELVDMRRQILAWEPALARSDLRLRLATRERTPVLITELRLDDRSWLNVRMRELDRGWGLALGRIVLALIPVIGLLIVGSLLIRRTLGPLRVLADATGRIGFGDQVVLAEAGTAEVRRLIRAFNDMQARIHQLIDDRTEALAAVGHDMRTPLARLQFRLEAVPDPELRAAIGSDVGEMEAMIASLLAFFGGENDPEPPSRIDLAVMIATVVDDLADAGRPVEYRGLDHLECSVRPMAMKRALANLIENALFYGHAARVTLEARADGPCILVEDDGPGIAEERMTEAMRPFTRLDPARGRNTHGLGLGLAIVQRVVETEGGTFRLFNRRQGGLCAAIHLKVGAEDTLPH